MDPSTEFGSMLQTAMKIKGAQMESDRRTFETWPLFMQNSMWMQGRALELREMAITERLDAARPLKDTGNDLFRAKEYSSAIEQYEAALGSFKYAKQLDADWKKKGIRDESIVLVDERGNTDDERRAVADFEASMNHT